LKDRVVELGLDAQVTFRGRVPRDQIPGLLSGSNVFLFTSAWEEPIARTVMEAMAAELVVIGTAVGGQREMLEDGVNALVFSPEDADGLAACILRLRRNPALRAQLAKAGRRTVLERFTLERMIDEIEAWLEEIEV
jgi:glycosyltransferase involved in cell wall biosynthesis